MILITEPTAEPKPAAEQVDEFWVSTDPDVELVETELTEAHEHTESIRVIRLISSDWWRFSRFINWFYWAGSWTLTRVRLHRNTVCQPLGRDPCCSHLMFTTVINWFRINKQINPVHIKPLVWSSCSPPHTHTHVIRVWPESSCEDPSQADSGDIVVLRPAAHWWSRKEQQLLCVWEEEEHTPPPAWGRRQQRPLQDATYTSPISDIHPISINHWS